MVLCFSSGVAKLGYPFYSGLPNPTKSPLSSGRSGMDSAHTLMLFQYEASKKTQQQNKTKRGRNTVLEMH